MKESVIFGHKNEKEKSAEAVIKESKDRKGLTADLSSPELPWKEDDGDFLAEKEKAHASRKQYLREKVRGRFIPVENLPANEVSENPEDAILEKVDAGATEENIDEFDEITYGPALKEKKWIPREVGEIIRKHSKPRERLEKEAEVELKYFRGSRLEKERKKKDIISRKVGEIRNKIQSAIENIYTKPLRRHKKKGEKEREKEKEKELV